VFAIIYFSLIRLLVIPNTIPLRIRIIYISSLLSVKLWLRTNRVTKSKSFELITVPSILIIALGKLFKDSGIISKLTVVYTLE